MVEVIANNQIIQVDPEQKRPLFNFSLKIYLALAFTILIFAGALILITIKPFSKPASNSVNQFQPSPSPEQTVQPSPPAIKFEILPTLGGGSEIKP